MDHLEGNHHHYLEHHGDHHIHHQIDLDNVHHYQEDKWDLYLSVRCNKIMRRGVKLYFLATQGITTQFEYQLGQ